MKIKVKSLDVGLALQLLDDLGSSEDPIFFRGKEITPNDFFYNDNSFSIGDKFIDVYTKASQVRIKYWGIRNGKFGLYRGSLYSMVLDRLQK